MKRYWLWLAVLTLIVTACQQVVVEPTSTMTDVPTRTATITQTATITPTPTRTLRPTKTPTITPIPSPTVPIIEMSGNPVDTKATFPDVEPINSENIELLEELGHWGYGTLYDVKLSPDESQVVAAASTGILWLNSETLAMEHFVPYQKGCNLYTVELSYATDMAACIDQDRTNLVLFNTSDGSIIEVLTQEPMSDVWFTPDDEEIVVAAGGASYSWNFHDQQWTDMDVENLVYIDFSQDASAFVTLGNWHKEPFYYSKNGERISFWKTIDDGRFMLDLESIDLSDDGRLLALGNWWEQSVLVWDIEQEQPIFDQCVDSRGCWQSEEGNRTSSAGKQLRPSILSGPDRSITNIQITADNQYIIFEASEAFEISKLYVYSLETGELVNSLEKTEGEILLFSEQDRFLVWSEEALNLYSYSSSEPLAASPTCFNMEAEMISPDAKLMANIFFDEVRLLNINTGEVVYSYQFPGTPSGLDFFHNDSRLLVTLSGNFQGIYIWNYITDDIQRITEEPQDEGYPQWYNKAIFPSVSHDDRLIFFQLFFYLGYIYDLENDTYRDMGYSDWWEFHPTQNWMMTDGDDGPYILSYDGLETEWDMITFNECKIPYHTYDNTWGLLPSGSGYFCTIKGMLKVYDNEGNEVHTVMDWNHIPDTWGPYPLPAFHDDSLVIGFEQNQMNIFDIMAEEKLATFILPAKIDSVLVSSDGTFVVVNGVDGVVRIYGVLVEGND